MTSELRGLDADAPTIEAEYVRFLDGDYLGKLLFRNMLVHSGAAPIEAVHSYLSRYGILGRESREIGDVVVDIAGARSLKVEIKLARLGQARSGRASGPAPADREARLRRLNWAFSGLKKTPMKEQNKSYDVAVAIGVRTLGHEHPDYWWYEAQENARLSPSGERFLPHEAAYLGRCGFFIFPFAQIPSNFFRAYPEAIRGEAKTRWFAWGNDLDRCRTLWEEAVEDTLRAEANT